MVGPMEILVALVNRQMGHGSSKSGRFSGGPYMITFLDIRFSVALYT